MRRHGALTACPPCVMRRVAAGLRDEERLRSTSVERSCHAVATLCRSVPGLLSRMASRPEWLRVPSPTHTWETTRKPGSRPGHSRALRWRESTNLVRIKHSLERRFS
ncbi:MAG: hypothetical protein QOJ85_2630 [Solirubrobacteraceae bacterium]|jgi:hypothetical protein|nr:hypothetical protein [Solirubrobacteraceae bacterium]